MIDAFSQIAILLTVAVVAANIVVYTWDWW